MPYIDPEIILIRLSNCVDSITLLISTNGSVQITVGKLY